MLHHVAPFFARQNQSMKIILGIIAVALSVASPAAAQQEVPSNLQVVGTIAGAGGVTPAVNDIVRVVLASNLSSLQGQGTVLAADGTFFVDMSKTQSFNGTPLTMLLQKSSGTYQLNNGTSAVNFAYSGTFPFPSRISFALTIGSLVSGGGGGGGGGGTTNDAFDVNGDGVFNQADVDAIKGALGQRRPSEAYDVNNDGIVNTRDAIDAIKALNTAGRSRTTPAAQEETETTQ